MALDTWPIKSHVFKPGVTEIPKLEDANLAGTKHSEELQKKTRRVSVALHGYVAKSLVLEWQECTLILTEGDSAKARALNVPLILGQDFTYSSCWYYKWQ